MMSTRKIALYIVLLVIIIGGTPYFTGYLVEAKFKDVVQVISGIDSVSIEVVEYKRGWRSSVAQTKVTLSNNYSQQLIDHLEGITPEEKYTLRTNGLSFLLDHKIHHGPLVQTKEGHWRFALATFHSQVLLANQVEDILKKVLGQSRLLDIDGKMSIDGAINIHFESDSIKLMASGIQYLYWQGGKGSWRLSPDMKHFEAQFSFPELMFQTAGKTFTLEAIDGKYDQRKSIENLWLGKSEGSFKKLIIKDEITPENSVDFSDITLFSNAGVEAGLIKANGGMNIQQIQMTNQSFGPFSLDISSEKLDPVFLKAIFHFSQDMQQAKTMEARQALSEQVKQKLSNFLKNRPELDMHTAFVTPKGPIKGAFSITLGGERAHDINNFNQIIQSIVAKAEAMLPKSILLELMAQQYGKRVDTSPDVTAEQATQQRENLVKSMIDNFLKEKYLVEKENDYLSVWEFTDGKLIINGEEKTFPQALGTAGVGIPSAGPASNLPQTH